jgi:hypothetical protein
MFTRRQIERLNRGRIRSIRAHYAMLRYSVSQMELKGNTVAREHLLKILKQIELIEELNRRFERPQPLSCLSQGCPFKTREK